MDKWWQWHIFIGEAAGSLVLVFGALLAIYLVKEEKYGLTKPVTKRIFLGVAVASAVVIGLVTAVGFGGHGQINPALSLMVAGMEGHFEGVLNAIAGQLFGGALAALFAIITIKIISKRPIKGTGWGYLQQSPWKTMGAEVFGNILWFIPIVGMLVMMVHVNTNPGSVDLTTFGHFQLGIAAFFAKFLLISIFEEFGAANFNSVVWFGKMIVTLVSKGKPNKKEVLTEMTGLVTTLGMGLASGGIAYLLLHHNTL